MCTNSAETIANQATDPYLQVNKYSNAGTRAFAHMLA
jgi:hypothetical protein